MTLVKDTQLHEVENFILDVKENKKDYEILSTREDDQKAGDSKSYIPFILFSPYSLFERTCATKIQLPVFQVYWVFKAIAC